MFPRFSLLYRLAAICIFVCLVFVVFNTRDDTRSRRTYALYNSAVKKAQGPNPFNEIGMMNSSEREHVIMTTRPSLLARPTTENPKVNPHNFHFIINPKELCNMTNLKYVIYIHSSPKHSNKRQMVRQTWGSKQILSKYKMRLVFIMGVVNDSHTMDSVKLESNRYGDIVVESFLDSYRNLTYKAVASLKWVSTFCAKAAFVIKSDDDILIDINALMDYMKSTTVQNYGTKNIIMCNQWLRMKVIRDKKSKWFISTNEFPDEYFPPYCSGSAFVLSMDVAIAMYRASFETKFFWVDDFYVTGLLAKRINVQQKRLNDAYILNAKVALEKLTADKKHELKFFHVQKLTQIYKMWSILKERTNVTCEDCFTWSPELVI